LNILDIRVQKLFVIVLTLKVLSSGLGWYLQLPWTLGFAVPLALMTAYVGLGIHRRDTGVSDEKFADTCYYLGFIFTITSIIFSLFDLPNIGTRIQDIAVRFGAAMVSTVLGLGVRVFLVSFRPDVADAIRAAEDALLGATQTFTERLTMSLERLQDFESRVDIGARSTVERVHMQVEALSKNHAEKLTEFFAELTTRNQEAFTNALTEIKNASVRLTHSVDRYSSGMKGNLASIEDKVTAFAQAITARLQNTTFPDDYFARHLAGPMSQLEAAAGDIAKKVEGACAEMDRTTGVLAGSLRKVQDKSNRAEAAMDTVLRLAKQQHLVLESAEGQLSVLEQVTASLNDLERLFNNAMAELAASNDVSTELATQVRTLTTESTEVRQALGRALTTVSQRLGEQTTASAALTSRMDATAATTERLVAQLSESASAQVSASTHLEASARLANQVASKYGTAVEVDQVAAQALVTLGDRADKSLAQVRDAVTSLHDVVRHIGELNATLRGQGGGLRSVAERTVSPPVGALAPSFTAPGTAGRPSLLTLLPSQLAAPELASDAAVVNGSLPEIPVFRPPQPVAPASHLVRSTLETNGHAPGTQPPPSAQG